MTSVSAEKCQEFRSTLDEGIPITPTSEEMLELLPLLGEPDRVTRDELARNTISRILKQRDTPTSLRRDVVEELLSDNYLSFHLGEHSPDHAIRRSFSALTIADAIDGDRTYEGSLDAQTLSRYSGELRRYLALETDRRGYDSELGPVDCIVHASDGFTALAQHPQIRLSDLSENFLAVLDFIEREGANVFRSQEETRLGKALAATLIRLDEGFIHKFLLSRFTKSYLTSEPSHQNFINTFRAVYLDILWSEGPDVPILGTLKNIILCNL